MKEGLGGCLGVFLGFAVLTLGVSHPGPAMAAGEIKVG